MNCGDRTYVTLLTCRATMARKWGSAAEKCSNQTDLHLTFTGPV